MENNKMSIVVSAIIFLAVIAVLVYITINKKGYTVAPVAGINQENKQNNMQNSNQPVEGVKITILKEGNGAVAKSGDTVAMNYTGKLANGTVFDSNIDPKFKHVEPFPFTIGAGEVIKGWDVGVAGMKVGEKRLLEIAPEFGYGARGAGSAIPPNATLIFEVELVAIKN